MKKSKWIELIEWFFFAMVALFVMGVVAMRAEITSPEVDSATAPRISVEMP